MIEQIKGHGIPKAEDLKPLQHYYDIDSGKVYQLILYRKKLRSHEIIMAPTECSSYYANHGESTVDVKCAFCKVVTTVYVWSFHGSGKRCPNCNALMCMGMAWKEVK